MLEHPGGRQPHHREDDGPTDPTGDRMHLCTLRFASVTCERTVGYGIGLDGMKDVGAAAGSVDSAVRLCDNLGARCRQMSGHSPATGDVSVIGGGHVPIHPICHGVPRQ